MVISEDKYLELASLLLDGIGGDKRAYSQFLENILPILERIASRKLPAGDVDDVVQEIMLSVHKARFTFDGKRPIMPWLVAIARFRITDQLRKHYSASRHMNISIQGMEEILPDVTPGNAENEYIDELMNDMPDNHQRILKLMHIEGYTAKEVGTMENMNESAVKVAAHRAIKKIRKKFGT